MDKDLEEKVRKFDKRAIEIIVNICVSLAATALVLLLAAQAGWL